MLHIALATLTALLLLAVGLWVGNPRKTITKQ